LYSSIFNEVLFGNLAKLNDFYNVLNSHLLFTSKDIAQKYASIHHELLENGADVENDEDMEIYNIWKYKSC
jgi:hypothetical protein